MTDSTLQPVRALLERLGLVLMPTLMSTGQYQALADPEGAETHTPAAWETPTVTAADDPVPLPDALPVRIGRMIIKRRLGRGGMGEVYAAHDPELARDVAVKVVRDQETTTAARIARFVSEAQITGQLEHPGIVPVHEIGVTPEGALYYTMKRLRGRSLRELLEALKVGDEQWTLHRLLHVFVQICDAIAFAHSRGVLHRDLKPENLMVGSFGEVLVVDWGLAALLGTDDPYAAEPAPPSDGRVAMRPVRRTTSTWTEDGSTLGSPGYMAPEQAAGDSGRIGPPTDVFALGCVLYELLSLERAYQADNPLQLMFKLMSGPPPSPLEVAPDRRIPPELADIALQAMANEPGERPPEAGALGELVRSWLDGSRRRAAAKAHLDEAHVRWDAYLGVRDEQAQLMHQERRLDAETPPWTPMVEKAELLAVRARLDALGNERLSAFSGFVTACDQARAKDPDGREAADLLADGWWTRLLEAEAEGDHGRVRWCADRVREQAEERYAERLEGTGSVSLVTDPPGVQVLCQRVVREGVQWGLEEPVALGVTPLERT
ncbi:MAG: serine/threonine protein kinase, partial [Deltaproteobacteria bacterium]|nr:serine/threonine protein kinase [Deltaproteobacteria bacterium]